MFFDCLLDGSHTKIVVFRAFYFIRILRPIELHFANIQSGMNHRSDDRVQFGDLLGISAGCTGAISGESFWHQKNHFHLDNDDTGRGAAQAIKISLEGYAIYDEPPDKGTDVNDHLICRSVAKK